MHSSKKFADIFYMLIIAIFLFSLSGCGYKEAPYYLEEAPKSDENVKFIIKKDLPKTSNETCE